MSKRIYALLREKNKIEKKQDEILEKLLSEIIDWGWNDSNRKESYKNYLRSSEELKIIRQQLELELAHELADKGDIWVKEKEDNQNNWKI